MSVRKRTAGASSQQEAPQELANRSLDALIEQVALAWLQHHPGKWWGIYTYVTNTMNAILSEVGAPPMHRSTYTRRLKPLRQQFLPTPA